MFLPSLKTAVSPLLFMASFEGLIYLSGSRGHTVRDFPPGEQPWFERLFSRV